MLFPFFPSFCVSFRTLLPLCTLQTWVQTIDLLYIKWHVAFKVGSCLLVCIIIWVLIWMSCLLQPISKREIIRLYQLKGKASLRAIHYNILFFPFFPVFFIFLSVPLPSGDFCVRENIHFEALFSAINFNYIVKLYLSDIVKMQVCININLNQQYMLSMSLILKWWICQSLHNYMSDTAYLTPNLTAVCSVGKYDKKVFDLRYMLLKRIL